ncbi:hypothetical protein DFH08DRAFT_815251 [Mycena albidolilacea]|uniref:Uncharacterized protein n=1 Tax=Mycena albidolilacea TaxID=1033008 RepID=A0AAD6ZMK5_9AGAR|nr:hypothetical protein DFH08DRAFT_815251 [Mycena albidolilacea]
MSVPPPPSHDLPIECILLQTVPWDASQKGGNLLPDRLRNLREKAVTIGFNYGEENLAWVREEGFCKGKTVGFTEGVELEHSKMILKPTEAAALHEKALEAEWVWGYDVGWKLCSELQGSTQKANRPFMALPLDWAEDTGVPPIFPPTRCPLVLKSHLPAFNIAVTAPLTCIPHPSYIHHTLQLPDNSTVPALTSLPNVTLGHYHTTQKEQISACIGRAVGNSTNMQNKYVLLTITMNFNAAII